MVLQSPGISDLPTVATKRVPRRPPGVPSPPCCRVTGKTAAVLEEAKRFAARRHPPPRLTLQVKTRRGHGEADEDAVRLSRLGSRPVRWGFLPPSHLPQPRISPAPSPSAPETPEAPSPLQEINLERTRKGRQPLPPLGAMEEGKRPVNTLLTPAPPPAPRDADARRIVHCTQPTRAPFLSLPGCLRERSLSPSTAMRALAPPSPAYPTQRGSAEGGSGCGRAAPQVPADGDAAGESLGGITDGEDLCGGQKSPAYVTDGADCPDVKDRAAVERGVTGEGMIRRDEQASLGACAEMAEMRKESDGEAGEEEGGDFVIAETPEGVARGDVGGKGEGVEARLVEDKDEPGE
eukprot:Sspe_Gene.29626::Locus_14182_Transcript_1_1_Confidence_1.000_Length_1233::g.29626::m.29626